MNKATASLLVLALTAIGVAYTQPKPATVLDGVYTKQQAVRGEEQYEAICAACHEGDEPEATPPKGAEFIDRWRDAPLSFLYNFIHTRMPGNKPGSLTEPQYLDVVAFLLQTAGYPAGASDLTAAKTHEVLLVGSGGPKPLPANALVLAVGCLAAGSDGEWGLTSGTNPMRVREGDETTPEELAASKATALGQASYKLLNAEDIPAASKLKGQKVQAKGVLTKVANPYTLSVQSLEPAGEGCGK